MDSAFLSIRPIRYCLYVKLIRATYLQFLEALAYAYGYSDLYELRTYSADGVDHSLAADAAIHAAFQAVVLHICRLIFSACG